MSIRWKRGLLVLAKCRGVFFFFFFVDDKRRPFDIDEQLHTYVLHTYKCTAFITLQRTDWYMCTVYIITNFRGQKSDWMGNNIQEDLNNNNIINWKTEKRREIKKKKSNNFYIRFIHNLNYCYYYYYFLFFLYKLLGRAQRSQRIYYFNCFFLILLLFV